MTALQQLQAIQDQTYMSEDGDEYSVELLPPLTQTQIDQLAKRLPSETLPDEVQELLLYASGFEFYGLEEVAFDSLDSFGFENFFPHSIQLAGDGFGNFWIQDLDQNGQWGHIYYVCHDPAVIVKHSENLAEFIQHLDEYARIGEESNLDIIHEQTVDHIWRKSPGFQSVVDSLASPDEAVQAFAKQLPAHFVIADLRNKPVGSGFAWGKFSADIDEAVRHPTELLWGFAGKAQKGIISKLFGN